MRLSTVKGDVGYPAWADIRAAGHNVIVLLDGVAINHCEMADEEQGTVTVCAVDCDGRLTIAGDEFVRETHSGAVRIVISPLADASARH